jgi:hypothetical protein
VKRVECEGEGGTLTVRVRMEANRPDVVDSRAHAGSGSTWELNMQVLYSAQPIGLLLGLMRSAAE